MWFLKKAFKWLGIGFLTLFFLSIALPFLPVILDKFSSKTHKSYLAENSVALDLSKAGGTFNFDDDFYDNRLFMMGEMHGYANVQRLDLALLTHLNQTLGLRYYMAEFDPATAIIFNEFLRAGDETALLSVFDIWYEERQSQWGNLEFLDKIRSIRALNNSLPEPRKMKFIGVDGPPKQKFIELARNLNLPTDDPILDLNQELLSASEAREAGKSRYSHILSNITLMDKALPDAKFYGLWGISHIQKTGVNGTKSLSAYLNAGTENIPATFKNSVATLNTLCVADCSNMMLSGILPGIPKPENGEPFTEIPMSFDNTYMFRTRGIEAAKICDE